MSTKFFQSRIRLGLLMIPLLAVACTTMKEMRNDPFYESFYAPASLIMTNEENKEYRSLQTNEAKEEFIRRFWAVRDWDPATEESEGKIEFDRRIDYANDWFWGIGRSRGANLPSETKKGVGWKTERGRIYLILGPPDYYRFDGSAQQETDRSSWTRRTGEEVWYYSIYRLTVVFWGDRLMTGDGQLLEAMKTAKLNWIADEVHRNPQTALRFIARFENDTIILEVPPTRVNYKDEADQLIAEFRITVDITRDGNPVEGISKTVTLKYTEAEIIEMNNIKMSIPYVPPGQGRYKLVIKLADLMAMSPSDFHAFIEFKY